MAPSPASSVASGSMWKKAAPSITPAENDSIPSDRRWEPRSGSAPPASAPARIAKA